MREQKPGKVIGLKIESDRPEDDPKNLAIKLADAMQIEISAKKDAFEFRQQAQRERMKAKQHGNTLVMLREYNRKKKKAIDDGKEWNPSRMEPMETYDEDKIKKERIKYIERARELDDLANDYDSKAKEAQLRVQQLQKKLASARK